MAQRAVTLAALAESFAAFNQGTERAKAAYQSSAKATPACATCKCGRRTTHASTQCRRCRT